MLWFDWCPPQKICCSSNLSDFRVSSHLDIGLLKIEPIQIRSHWSRLGPPPNTAAVLMRRGNRHREEKPCKEKTDTEERWPCEGGGRDGSYAATNSGTPGATKSWKRHQKKPGGPASMAPTTLSFGTCSLQICGKMHFWCFKPPSLWPFIMPAQGS